MIKAAKMSMDNSECKTYWTPAPPKWDMAPTYVKQVLFPDYHGPEYNICKYTASTPTDTVLVDDEADKKWEEAKTLRCHSKLAFVHFNIPPFTKQKLCFLFVFCFFFIS